MTRVPSEPFETQRHQMVETQLKRRGITDARVLKVMDDVPRHCFVATPYTEQAYEDNPLPTALEQTISQPYIVALMTEALALEPHHRVLEIGTGSGYQTAILCALCAYVYSIERHGALSNEAGKRLKALGYENVSLKVGDGTAGWAAHAPYDAILIAATGSKVPQPLMNQLNPDHGRLLIPLQQGDGQELVLLQRTPEKIKRISYGPVRFVPLIGQFT